jgi:hypothetical protein
VQVCDASVLTGAATVCRCWGVSTGGAVRLELHLYECRCSEGGGDVSTGGAVGLELRLCGQRRLVDATFPIVQSRRDRAAPLRRQTQSSSSVVMCCCPGLGLG